MKRVSRFFSGTTAAVLSLSSLLAMSFPGIAHAVAQTCTWTGAGSDTKFSTVENWSNCGGAVPVAGDIIRFDNASVPAAPATGVAPTVLTNDLSVALGGVETYKSDNATQAPTTVYVDTLQLADGGYLEATAAPALSGKLALIVGTVPAGQSYVSAGPIDNLGSVEVRTSGFQFSAFPRVASGMTITLGDGVSLSAYQVNLSATGTTLALQNGSMFSAYPTALNTTYGYNLVVGGGDGTATPKLTVGDYGTYDSVAQKTIYEAGETIFAGDVTLNNDLDVTAGNQLTTTVKFTGAVTGSGSIKRNVASVGKLITPAGELTNPVKDTALDGDVVGDYNTPGAYVTVYQNETTTLNGKRSDIYVLPGGIIKGTGTVTNEVYIEDGGVIAPGNSPGCLTTGTLTLNGEYQFELGGDEPCDGYDQIVVTNTTGTTVTFDADAATLTTSRYNGYTPEQGQVFTIIENEGSEAVSGTFKGLVEGATFEQNGIVFKISYVGGDGNDVTLTVQNVPTVPDTGFALVTANPVLSLGLMTVAAGLIFAIARRTRLSNVVAHSKSARRIKK